MKRKMLIVILICILSLQIIGCGAKEPTQFNVSSSQNLSSNQLGRFIKINDDLYYDFATRIVYIFNRNIGSFTAYYAPNGFPFKYNPETNTFEEIINLYNN